MQTISFAAGSIRQACLLLLLAVLAPFPSAAGADADLASLGYAFRQELQQKTMPYWYDTAVDWKRGGYLLSDDAVAGRRPAREKQLVGQTRMIWTFSHIHRKGLCPDPKRDYLLAARQGYDFLIRFFQDPENGGYYWKTDLSGNPTQDSKLLYGQSFVVYALVEYYRASGDKCALNHAMRLYEVIDAKLHDDKYGGWMEHAARNWELLRPGDPRNEVEVVGLKSANSHLHYMEALAELYEETDNWLVGRSLKEALRINRTYFYPADARLAAFHRNPDWSPVQDPQSAGLSYGHNVEFAWLMLRAQEVLDQKPAWSHFDTVLRHSLQYGYDWERGGLYDRGFSDSPAAKRDKVWWAQAEMMAALSDALRHQFDPSYREALIKLCGFVRQYQADPKDGIWMDTVTEEGKPKSTGKAHNWKANYHDVRAIVKFVETFAP
jgi:mannose/cellobiose epimerase-like protein (N-acyl-D-glucosamine 2-epimerase family)